MTRTECSNFAQYRRNTGRFGNADQHFPGHPLFLCLSLALSPSGRAQARCLSNSLLPFSTLHNTTAPSRILSSWLRRANYQDRCAFFLVVFGLKLKITTLITMSTKYLKYIENCLPQIRRICHFFRGPRELFEITSIRNPS